VRKIGVSCLDYSRKLPNTRVYPEVRALENSFVGQTPRDWNGYNGEKAGEEKLLEANRILHQLSAIDHKDAEALISCGKVTVTVVPIPSLLST
jgi:hypothetical protein